MCWPTPRRRAHRCCTSPSPGRGRSSPHCRRGERAELAERVLRELLGEGLIPFEQAGRALSAADVEKAIAGDDWRVVPLGPDGAGSSSSRQRPARPAISPRPSTSSARGVLATTSAAPDRPPRRRREQDPHFLSGQLRDRMLRLLGDVADDEEVYAAIFELGDLELVPALAGLGRTSASGGSPLRTRSSAQGRRRSGCVSTRPGALSRPQAWLASRRLAHQVRTSRGVQGDPRMPSRQAAPGVVLLSNRSLISLSHCQPCR
jgi:hypothetical protein